MNQTIYVKRFDTSAVCDVTEDFVLRITYRRYGG